MTINFETEAFDILKEAKRKNIILFVEGEKLKFKTDGKIKPGQEFIDRLVKHKDEIKHLLSVHTDKAKQVSWLKIRNERMAMHRVPLSFSQERLWFIDQLEGSIHYHIPWVMRVKGALNVIALENSFQDIVNRHEVLRTVFREEEGLSYQEVIQPDSWKMEIINGNEYASNKDELRRFINSLVEAPFNLSQDHMLRVQLSEDIGHDEHLMIVTLHHIASDGWSWGILLKELMSLYRYHTFHIKAVLPDLPIQFSDYSIWQRHHLQGEAYEKKLSYWRSKLSGTTPLLLPLDYARPSEQSTHGGNIQVDIDEELTKNLKQVSQTSGVTLFMTMLSVFKVLLYRWSGQTDICIGTPVAGRTLQETEGLIGFFINTLALRSDLDGNTTFNQFLQSVKQTTLEAFEYQDVPFAKIVEMVATDRDMSRNPVFQVMFVMQNTPKAGELKLGENTSLSYEDSTLARTKYDLTVTIYDSGNGMGLYVEYCTDLFRVSTVERMMLHYKNLLAAIVTSSDTIINRLPMLTGEEETQLLKEFNDTSVTYPKDITLVDLFCEQCKKAPSHIAVMFGNEQLTYKELDERSNQLAQYLRAKGIVEETLVPLCLQRSLEMMIGIMGILKAGAAYVPVDPGYPEERISYMLADTSATLVLSDTLSDSSIPANFEGEIILLDKWNSFSNEPVTKPRTALHSKNLAYLIYTSGSTGRPKGVMNQHDGIVNRLLWAQDQFQLTSEDTVLQKTTFCFDVSVWELIWPLLVGSKIVLANPSEHKDPGYLKNVIREKNISVVHFVPSMLDVFLSEVERGECKELKKVLCSGEALKSSQVSFFIEKLPGVELHNLYGPTEAAIDVTWWSLRAKENVPSVVPIGKPVANTSIYIMNTANSLAPVGVSGEIYIGGIQVARGYLNRDELTVEKFIKDPFRDEQGAKLYRTGDIGRWLPDGNVEYLGRMDDQLKIRGYRVEPGEIESVVQQSGMVKQCVVISDKDKTDTNRLIGYVTVDTLFDRELMIEYLQQHLPEHMIPRLWVLLDNIPLTVSGKVDKRSLPKADGAAMSTKEFVAPRNETDALFADIWQELLGIEQVGINDNFFSLGGHSLLVIRMLHKAKEHNYYLQFRNVFQYPTIAKLADHICGNEEAEKKLTGKIRDIHSQVMLLNDCEDGEPLFLLPGSPGFCDPYEELAVALAPVYKVYGIQMPGLRKGDKRVYSLEEMASHAVQWIKQIQPEGPYRFVGHSFGGYMSFEITKQLELNNDEVEFICFLDTRADASQFIMSAEENILQNICDFLKQNGLIDRQYPDWGEQLKSEMANCQADNRVLFIINFVKDKITAENKKVDYFMWMVLETVIIQSQMHYYPSGKVGATFIIIKAEDAGNSKDEYLGWQEHSNTIIKIKAPGDHTTLIKNENAGILASKIKLVGAKC
ncbi:MAG: amino acid adenylation domain-containing protein [Chitinophagaceae bacterium]